MLFISVKRAVTILNNNGDDEAEINVFYDKANSIKDIRGVVYDEFGKQVGKITAVIFRIRARHLIFLYLKTLG